MSKLAYTEDFEVFWKAYPRTPIMSKIKAFQCWKKLDDDDRASALLGLLAYKDWLKARPDHPACHATTFLNQRRFEGFAEALKQSVATPGAQKPQTPTHGAPWGSGIWIQEGSEEWDAWCAHCRSQGAVHPPTDRFGGWCFETPWPPIVVSNMDLSEEWDELARSHPLV